MKNAGEAPVAKKKTQKADGLLWRCNVWVASRYDYSQEKKKTTSWE